MNNDFAAEPDDQVPESAEQEKTESASEGTELCVPTSALAMPDEQDQMTEPSPGDAVTLQVEAKVSRVEGEMAYVTVQTVNGVEMKGPPSPQPSPPGEGEGADPEYAALEQSARGQMLS